MEITRKVIVGSLESADLLLTIGPNKTKEIKLNVSSPFIKQYGEEIKLLVLDELKKYQIHSAEVMVQDQGALPVVIQARISTAIERLNKGAKDNE